MNTIVTNLERGLEQLRKHGWVNRAPGPIRENGGPNCAVTPAGISTLEILALHKNLIFSEKENLTKPDWVGNTGRHAYSASVMWWNDQPYRKFEEVEELYLRTIRAEKAKEARELGFWAEAIEEEKALNKIEEDLTSTKELVYS